MTCLYNENDPFAAAWLRNLAELIAPGVVDERSIADLRPGDLADYKQAHFFAGIGGWSYALRLAGWPDDRPVWTGSCPCQPFSSAGKGEGFADPRHLWPAWFRLIRECRPPVVFGEQVASPAGLAWFDHVSTDLEAEGYAIGAADLGAASVGAPHIRQRLFFVADRISAGTRRDAGAGACSEDQGCGARDADGYDSGDVLVARSPTRSVANSDGRQPRYRGLQRSGEHGQQPQDGGASRVVHSAGRRRQEPSERNGEPKPNPADRNPPRPDADRSNPWASAVWLPCRDGKARPTQPGLFPLAHGIPNRVGTLRGAGNAIIPQVAAEFVRAYMESGA